MGPVEKIGKVRDHINKNKLDNRESNLRCVDYSLNNRNSDKKIRNIYGIPGAYKAGNKIAIRIHLNGETKYIGCFNTIEEAKEAHKMAEMKYGIER